MQDLTSFAVIWTKSNVCPWGQNFFLIVTMLGWSSYLLIIESNISSLSKFSGIGSLNPMPSAISLKYLLNILATVSDSLIIESFSHSIISILVSCLELINGRPEMLILWTTFASLSEVLLFLTLFRYWHIGFWGFCTVHNFEDKDVYF